MNYSTCTLLALALLCLVSVQSTAIAQESEVAEVGVTQNDEPTQTTTQAPTTTQTPTTQPPKIAPVAKPKNNKNKNLSADPAPAKKCPDGCNCAEKPKKITCSGAQLKTFPDLQAAEWTGLVSIELENTLMDNVDLNLLSNFRDTLENLDLSSNDIKNFSPAPTKKDKDSFAKLKSLSLSNNSLQALGKLSSWKFPSLETLDLSANPIIELGQFDFNNTKNLQNLNIQYLQLKSIHEQSFAPLGQLKKLNMTGTKLEQHLGDKQFAGSQKLETVDLTDNGLVEVPFSLRGTNSITKLLLSGNLMTSLRQSDFINRTKLTDLELRRCPELSKVDELTFSDLTSLRRLVLADNQRLKSISKDAFKSKPGVIHTLDLIDIRNNNISALANPFEFASLTFKQLLISGNPWHCDCDLRWFYQFPSQSRPLAHCKSPAQLADMEVGESLTTIDCEIKDSIMRTVVVTGFILFLFILLVLVVVQKSDICRRFLWRDQYGTIYYTKASFPPETI